MLNQTNVNITSGTTRKTILVDEQNSTAFSCMVTNDGVSVDDDGRKIIKAGTPVSGDLTKRETAFKVVAKVSKQAKEGGDDDDTNDTPTTTADPAVGIILHDVDVTKGTANSQVVVFGFIDVSKLDSDVVAMLTDDVKSNLKMIQFVK